MPHNAKQRAANRFYSMYTALRERICFLDHPPGVKLREDDLAAEFNVSRTPVRKVLARLETDGLVRSVQSVGTIVTDLEPDQLHEVYQLRAHFALLLGEFPNDAQFEDVLQITRRIARETEDNIAAITQRQFAQLNLELFRNLLRLCSNQTLCEICEALYYRSARLWIYRTPRMGLRMELQIFVNETTEILRALESGDIKAISMIRAAHIRQSWRRISSAL